MTWYEMIWWYFVLDGTMRFPMVVFAHFSDLDRWRYTGWSYVLYSLCGGWGYSLIRRLSCVLIINVGITGGGDGRRIIFYSVIGLEMYEAEVTSWVWLGRRQWKRDKWYLWFMFVMIPPLVDSVDGWSPDTRNGYSTSLILCCHVRPDFKYCIVACGSYLTFLRDLPYMLTISYYDIFYDMWVSLRDSFLYILTVS